MFIELPNEGEGKGSCKMKIGDGVTTYSNLPYAMGDTSNYNIDDTIVKYQYDSVSSTVSIALQRCNQEFGTKLSTIISAFEKCIMLMAPYVPQFKIALKDGIGYYKTDNTTFVPFKKGVVEYAGMPVYRLGIGSSFTIPATKDRLYIVAHSVANDATQTGKDINISSVSGGTLIAGGWIRHPHLGHHQSSINVIRATSSTITVYMANGGTGYVSVVEVYGT